MSFIGRHGWAAIVALAIVALPFLNQIAQRALGPGPGGGGAAVELELMREDIALLRDTVERLRRQIDEEKRRNESRDAEVARLIERGFGVTPPDEPSQPLTGSPYANVLDLNDPRSFNKGLEHASPRFLEGVFGPPRVARDFTDECQAPDNPRLLVNLALEDVGPFKTRMLKPAIDSLKRIFDRVRVDDPELFDVIGHAGSLCGRLVRGSTSSISAHAWGAAVDIRIDGVLDPYGDGYSQYGLITLAEYFRDEGWYWGAAFRREDSMHFEVSRQTIEGWAEAGLIDLSAEVPDPTRLAAEGEDDAEATRSLAPGDDDADGADETEVVQ